MLKLLIYGICRTYFIEVSNFLTIFALLVTTHLYGWGEVRHNFHPDPSLFLDDKFVLIFNKIIQK